MQSPSLVSDDSLRTIQALTESVEALREETRQALGEFRSYKQSNQTPWEDMLDPFVAQDYSLRRNLEKTLWDNTQNIHWALRWQETLKAATFVRENIPLNLHFDPARLRYDALEKSGEGLYLEFGVDRAFWINAMAACRPDVTFYGFDVFEGLPEPWSLWPKGHFDNKGSLPDVRENVTLIKGLFQETLEGFLQEHEGPLAFMHLDCDIYSASKYVLEKLQPRLVPGTRIVFDDFLTQPGWEDDQFRAFMEFVEATGLNFEYTGYTRIPPCTGVSIIIK